jgi:hypothetical protein
MARILRKQALSMRGTPVDFGALQAQNPTLPTLGNTRTNVRGDQLGDNGVILKTQEEIEAEWARKRELQERINKNTSIKADQIPAPTKTKTTVPQDVQFPTIGDLVDKGVIPTPGNKKRIVDSD